jgi:superfamily II DNA or RNA helicase/predicted RNA methylase
MRDFTKHALALFAAPAVAPADPGALAPRTSVIAALVVARPHEAIVHPPIAANNRAHVVPTRAAQASDAPARRTSTLAALLLTGVASPAARAPDAPTRRTSAIAAMMVAPPRDHALSRSSPPKDEHASAAPDATAETALIVAMLRDQARELPTTTTGVKSASILRACAVTIESRQATPTQTALEARGMAVAHLRSVAAKTSGKPGEAIFLAAKAIETGSHRAEWQSKDNGAASPVSAPSARALSAATPSSSTSRPEKLAPVTAHGRAPVQTGHGAGPSSRARILTETPSTSTPAAVIDSLAALKRLPLGTRLRLVRNHSGPMDSGRVLVEVKSKSIGLRIDDPNDKRHGEVSWYEFKPGFRVASRPDGFAILHHDQVHVEYRFETANQRPAPVSPAPSLRAGVEAPVPSSRPAESVKVGSIVRYLGSQHPHLAGLEGSVLAATPNSITVQWRHLGGTRRPPTPRDPPSYREDELRVLRGYTQAFRASNETVEAPSAPSSTKALSQRAAPEPQPDMALLAGLCRRGADLYGDTRLLTFAGQIPGFAVSHMGFGEFELVTPAGNVDFDRSRGRDFPGQTGRSHLLYGPPEAMALLLRELNARGVVPTTAAEGESAVTAPEPVSKGKLAAPESAKAPSVRASAPIEATRVPAADEEGALSDRSWLRAAAMHDAGAMVGMFGPGIQARVGGVRVKATPDWKPPKARGQAAEYAADEADEPASHALSPIEHRTAAARRDANIKAMWLAADLETHPRPLTDDDRLTLAAYSDWGGIGLAKSLDKFPPGFDAPDTRQLIHAYFTPPRVCAEIARLVQPLLPGLVATDGRVHALEPAVGIGRFPLALSGRGFETVTWHCVEFSKLSYKMLHALRPDIDLYQGPFEGWVAAHGADFAGRLKLVISNPPYGQRSYATTEDPDRSYRYKRADDYFLRRGLDLLAPGGLGIYIIPSGFLTGMTKAAVALRAEVLRRHHLSAAFRLPNEVFSLANVVTDILIFRARETILADVDEADKFLVEGRYYEEFPGHILGTVVPNEAPKPGEPAKRGWHTSAEGYTVVGEFTALPPVLEERPICASCSHAAVPPHAAPPPTPTSASKATPAQQLVDNDERMLAVSSLGRRVEGFLASVANPDREPVGWEELRHDLLEWASLHGAPSLDAEVLGLASAERGPLGKGPPGGAGWLLKAFLGKSVTLIPSLAERPQWMPRFTGNKNDPLQWGDYLYRSRKTLTIDELPGQDPSALFATGWSEDSLAPAWTERLDARGQLVPPDEYLFGELWPKFDRAQARAALGDAQAAAQAKQLIELIQPATFDEIEVTPQDGFVPLDLLATWMATLNHGDPVALLRDKGLTLLANVAYEDHNKGLGGLSQEALLLLGWINHDYVVFQPQAGETEKVDDIRLAYAKEWTEGFRGWLDADPERQRLVEQRYQRARQGYRAHAYGAEPLKLARWNPAIVLNPHQIAGARRLDANRGGGLGFDVGVGKTYTILAALALARQSGRARRAVIVVPQPIAFQWVDNIGKALPDFRVVVIGINKKTIAHGLRRGLETSETDSPEERSRKWARFQGGEFDVAILTYDSLPRTQMDQASTLHFLEGVTAIEREVELKKRNAAKAKKGLLKKYQEERAKLDRKLEKALEAAEMKRRYGTSRKNPGDPDTFRAQLVALDAKHTKTLTERQDAILIESVGEWLAQMLELPVGWKHDPDIVWNTMAVDWLAFDEGHNGKNLHMPSSREGGSVPKFMGNEGEGSKRAWHWFFRCCDVQSRGGEVVVATATPASNSPVEFYNLVKLMDKDAWNKIGINDPEAFIDRFCLLEPQEVLNSEMETETRLACVGFKNLDELRSVIMKHWEFKTAKQAKLKLPAAKVDRVFVDMDADQEVKYQQYIKEIEDALSKPKEGSHKILGLLAKMAMVAMHSQLDEKFDWKTAGMVSSPESPKFLALAAKILAQRGCGHIIFADYIAAHVWIRDVLVAAGIPVERIGILNAVVAPSAADRQRVAREFNGDRRAGVAPRFDILIANMVGEEGVDLQERTCAIHHMDIGWTPKKTEQRNGRGVRQGNTLSNINIFYYIANRSQDGSRLDMVRGKQNWISTLLEGEAKDTNNPAAQSTLSRKELLVLISRDPEKTRLRLEAAEAEREEERKVKVAKAASDTLRALVNRFERARTEQNPTIAAEFQSVARQKLAGLAKVPPDIWPWATWAAEAEHHSMLVPKEGGPVYEGLRVAMPRLLDRSVVEYAEFGRINSAGLDLSIGTRVAGAAHWDFATLEKVVALHLEPGMRVAEGRGGPSWPADDQAGLDTAMTAKWLPRLRSGSGSIGAWEALNWTQAPDRFVEEQWARWGNEIVSAMASTGSWAAKLQIPAIRNGQLVFGLTPSTSSVLPPTAAGWQRFLELAPLSGEKFTVLEEVGWWWFNRGIPRSLLAATREPTAPVSRAPARAA